MAEGDAEREERKRYQNSLSTLLVNNPTSFCFQAFQSKDLDFFFFSFFLFRLNNK